MKKLYTVNKNKTAALCGSDHELLIVKFKLKLKKVGKTTILSKYDLNQIPYDYTVEATKRFKGLDLKDRVLSILPCILKGPYYNRVMPSLRQLESGVPESIPQ